MSPLKLDCHVHLLGNGHDGSGCRVKLHGTARFFGGYMCRNFGLDSSVLNGDLEGSYVPKLAIYVRDSSLDKVVVLASDHVRNDRGEVLEKYENLVVPNDFVMKTCADFSEFTPGISIHPARPDAIDELERLAAGGARLLKLLPNYHNVQCSDPRYEKFWVRMRELGVVFLAHTGGELSLPNSYPEGRNPAGLRLPLECGVNVIAAHCGTRALPFERSYMDDFLQMLDRYPNLYGDNSALTAPNRSYAAEALARHRHAGRVLHGSDIPIPVSAKWLGWRGYIPRSEARRIDALANPLERDYLIKRALGYPEQSFTTLSVLMGLSTATA